jgi:hypothetical protein
VEAVFCVLQISITQCDFFSRCLADSRGMITAQFSLASSGLCFLVIVPMQS